MDRKQEETIAINREIEAIDPTVFLAQGAVCAGAVTIGRDSSVWYNAVIRADEDRITIGSRSNVQDSAVLHTDPEHPLVIGNDVSVGHGAILHGCAVGDGTVVGMGAIVLNGAVIGKHCLIGAGALVTGKTVIPDGMLAFGSPAKVIRQLTEEEVSGNLQNAASYVSLAKRHFRR